VNINDVYTITAILPALIVLHGSEGIGKTTTAWRFPSTIFGQTEDGCPSGVRLSTFGLLDSFDKVLQVITILAAEPHNFRTFVLDSLDALEVLVLRAVCAEHDWKTIETPGYGKGFVAADRWWIDFLDGVDFLRRERGMMVSAGALGDRAHR
jgi:DNA polymerase III delta prime subunit